MRPTTNLPNSSTVLTPILTKINKANINAASIYSYANFLLSIIKSDEKNTNLDEKINISNLNDKDQITKQKKFLKINDSLAYLYSVTDNFKSISNLSLIYDKYLNNNNTKTTNEIAILNKSESHSKRIISQALETITARKTTQEKLVKLCDSIEKATNSSNLVKNVLIQDLFQILYDRHDNPEIHFIINQKQRSLIKSLIKLRAIVNNQDKILTGTINECLSLIGYVDQTSIKHRGINILSLDGGGAKGLVTIEILRQIQKKCGGKPIPEIFDYICGVSTGAILAALLGVYKLPLDEIEKYYKSLSKDVFGQNMAAGITNLISKQSYYDTQYWEKTLRNITGNTLFINSAKDQNACKMSIVSNVTTPNQMKIFLFRNYHLPSFSQSHYDGTCKFKVWEAVRASSAAPGYYEDYKLDGYVFHDGGILANNPTAISIHEAKLLWPKAEINCVVSIGNGRYKPAGYSSSKAASVTIKQKLSRFVAGSMDPENINIMLSDLLPPKVYYRFNPYMSEEFSLDETRQEKWDVMKANTKMYMRRNDYKFKLASSQLLKPKTSLQKAEKFLNEKFKCDM